MPRKSGLIIKAFSKYVLHLYYGHSLAHADALVKVASYCEADIYHFCNTNANMFPGTA